MCCSQGMGEEKEAEAFMEKLCCFSMKAESVIIRQAGRYKLVNSYLNPWRNRGNRYNNCIDFIKLSVHNSPVCF